MKVRELFLVATALLVSCGQSLKSDQELEQIRIEARAEAVGEYWRNLYRDPQAMYDAWLATSCDQYLFGELGDGFNSWFAKTYDVFETCMSYRGESGG